jgi:uncharacterized membrane protein
MGKEEDRSERRPFFSYGVLIGVGIGVVVGFFLEDPLIGLVLGAALAIAFEILSHYL